MADHDRRAVGSRLVPGAVGGAVVDDDRLEPPSLGILSRTRPILPASFSAGMITATSGSIGMGRAVNWLLRGDMRSRQCAGAVSAGNSPIVPSSASAARSVSGAITASRVTRPETYSAGVPSTDATTATANDQAGHRSPRRIARTRPADEDRLRQPRNPVSPERLLSEGPIEAATLR